MVTRICFFINNGQLLTAVISRMQNMILSKNVDRGKNADSTVWKKLNDAEYFFFYCTGLFYNLIIIYFALSGL